MPRVARFPYHRPMDRIYVTKKSYLPYLFRFPLFCQCFYQHYNFHFPPVLIFCLPRYPSTLIRDISVALPDDIFHTT
uniref:Uncharacterized protein n=1 Tax=Magallana gigas TaxID=29159 RepID=K1Q3K1_MAGGI